MGRWSEGAGPMSQTQGEVGRDGWTEREREREKEGGREGGREGERERLRRRHRSTVRMSRIGSGV